VLDEPISALDAFTRADLQNHPLKIWQGTFPGHTLLIVTHDVDEAVILADRAVVMQPNPGSIACIHSAYMPRPHQRKPAGFDLARHSILQSLDSIFPSPCN